MDAPSPDTRNAGMEEYWRILARLIFCSSHCKTVANHHLS